MDLSPEAPLSQSLLACCTAALPPLWPPCRQEVVGSAIVRAGLSGRVRWVSQEARTFSGGSPFKLQVGAGRAAGVCGGVGGGIGPNGSSRAAFACPPSLLCSTLCPPLPPSAPPPPPHTQPFTPSPPHLPHTHTPTAAGVSGGGSAHSAEVRFAGGQGGAPRTRVGRLHGRWGHAAPSLLLPAVTRPICSLPRLPPSPLPCAPGPLQSPLAPCPSPRPCCTTSCPPATARPRPPCWWL